MNHQPTINHQLHQLYPRVFAYENSLFYHGHIGHAAGAAPRCDICWFITPIIPVKVVPIMLANGL